LLGAEALLRWQHPQYGFIPPADFIGLAEEFGLIVPIGEWVLEQVCQAQQRWFALGYHLKIAINLSAAQFNDYDLVKKIQKMLATYQLPAKAIEFEITENVLIKDFENALAIMHLLHEQQIDLSIDDFGIGYSSLSYLKEFPVQKLKIDRSFVQNIEKNPKDIGMLKGIINLGRGLGLKVLVEGVETEFELNLIKKLRADQLQGYYYAKPMSLHDFTHFMQDKSYGFSPKR
jgi:EAL domain-containing protein (putative c-di-GMP-specific phosphodiesterase class I)